MDNVVIDLNKKKSETKHKGIRSGKQYLEGLKDNRNVWMHGKKIKDVTKEPGLLRGCNTLASFFDNQHKSDHLNDITYLDDEGDRCGIAFKRPLSQEDIILKGKSYYKWATWSNGMFGRTPDYKNASLMSFAFAPSFLSKGIKGQGGVRMAENMLNYYNFVRKNDKVLTHTLVNPTYNHVLAAEGKFSKDVALHVVKETDDGIIVRGARLLATLGPLADEIEVFPSTVLKASDDNIPFAFAFAIPIATKGLKLICRDSFDTGKSNFDAPLASRYEEMDSVVIFDDVLVPWDRIFLYGEPHLCNVAFKESNAVVHMMHQVACGKLAKSEFIVGLLSAIVKASGRDNDLYSKGLIAEVMQMTETIRALLFSAEEQSHKDQHGNYIPLKTPLETSRNLFPRFYPRMIEILQMLGASSLIATPSEADFSNDISIDVQKYFQLANLESRDRVALFRLAHDVAISTFGNRQTLYERFFFGPPALMAAGYFDGYDKDKYIQRINEFLSSN